MPYLDKSRQKAWATANPWSNVKGTQEYRDRIQLQMVDAYGGKCISCGESDPVVLVLDHIYDNARGDREKNKHSGGIHMYAKLRRLGWPKDSHQLLCHNCNYRKEAKRRKENRKDWRALPSTVVDKKISVNDKKCIRLLYFAERRSQSEIANFFGISQTYVSAMVNQDAIHAKAA